MQDKNQVLALLSDEFSRWDGLLARLTEEQAAARILFSNWSIKDVTAHLMAWQRRSIARMEAALANREPEFPAWSEQLDRESEEPLVDINAWIYETHRERDWESVYREWRGGFLRFIELGKAVPENDLFTVGRYAWLPGYALSIVLVSSCEHHREHFDPVSSSLFGDSKPPNA